MKKRISLALLLTLAMAVNAFAAEFGIQPLLVDITSSGSITSENPQLDVTLEGEIIMDESADMISVLMPTQIYFNLMPDEEDWNKVVSPTVNVSNLGTSDVRVSVTKAVANGASLTTQTPAGNAVRLGIAPENLISESLLSSTYLLRSTLSDSSYIDLGLIGFNTPNNVARLKVFGDAASDVWNTGDIFTVQTIFKVTL